MIKQCMGVGPDRPHSVWAYTENIYKVVQFYRPQMHLGPGPRSDHKHYEEKLDASLSRARRVILEKALCNEWDYFCTFTLAQDKADRSDLPSWWSRFSQWLRDQRKKGFDIRFLIVPEQHGDGSWHAHGLLAGVPEGELISFKEMDRRGYRTSEGRRLPKKLRDSSYLNWPAYQKKFGFCSLGKIKDPIACGFYITKYITKDLDSMVKGVGLHTYYVSRGLNAAVKFVDFYGWDPKVDSLLVNKYEFCATGMTHVKDCFDWHSWLPFEDFSLLEPLEFSGGNVAVAASPAQLEADAYYDFEQLSFIANKF